MAEMITVRVRAFAGLREALGTSSITVSVAAGTDVAGLMAQLAAAHPDAGLPGRRLAVAVNRSYADRERVLQDATKWPCSRPSAEAAASSSRSPTGRCRWTRSPDGWRGPTVAASRFSPARCAASRARR